MLRSLDKDADADTLPLLPASHNGRGDALLMSRKSNADGSREVLHLWPAPLRLQPGDTPVWQGTVATLTLERRLGLLSLWRLEPQHGAARDAMAEALRGLEQRTATRDGNGVSVLLLSSRREDAP